MSKSVKRSCCGGSVAKGHTRACSDYRGYPHFIKPAFVGSAAALELVEAWYKAMGTQLDHPFLAHCGSQIGYLIAGDAFLVGIDPATVLRTMTLRFDVDLYDLSKYPTAITSHGRISGIC